MRNEDTFFRGYRRETVIDGASILCNAAGEKRLKLSLKVPLSGDQLVGMPSWVGEPFDDIAKTEFAIKSISSTMELDPMLLHVFATDQTEKEAITFPDVRMCSFKILHESESDADSIVLAFSAYLPRTGRFLKFADDNFGCSVFIRYEAAQQSLLDDNPNVQPIDEPKARSGEGGDNAEEEEEDEEQEEVTHDAPQGDEPQEGDQPVHAVAHRGPGRPRKNTEMAVVQ